MKPRSVVSTTHRGDQFRDGVAALLRTCYEDVQVELLVGGKAVDIVYLERRLGKWETIGVECKNYLTSLTATELSRIFQDYDPLVARGLLDDVLIIGTRPLGKIARERLATKPSFRYLTYEELEEGLIDFSGYIGSLSRLFDAEGLTSYYIEARFEGSDQKSAFREIQEWIDAENTMPLAILGGYGQGKTSLATRLVAHQAQSYLADPTKRMPVLVRLGEVVHETTLEGLFGKEFTSRHRSNYRFDTFRHLNEGGRLLIVLDGFDEMKHGMSSTDFRANFAEFNRLLVGKAKVILLGRPNSLPSEERTIVLQGKQTVAGKQVLAPTFSPWIEKTIAKFSSEETKIFLKKYLLHLISMNSRTKGILTKREVSSRVNEVVKEVDPELIWRPVHARIVAELAITPGFSFKGFREYDLYAQFLNQILRRDAELKRARRKIGVEDRMRFQERLAFWAWSRKNKTQGWFLRKDIPATLLEGLNDGETDDVDATLTEYIVSTVTDEKEAGGLIFAHRSFQEFLVAEYMRKQSDESIHHERQSSLIDEAIVPFLRGAPNQEFVDRWYSSIPRGRAELSSLYLSLFCNESVLNSIFTAVKDKRSIDQDQPTEISPAQAGILGLSAAQEGSDRNSKIRVNALLRDIVKTDRFITAEIAFHFLLRAITNKTEAAELLSIALGERPSQRLEAARQSDATARRITLVDDSVIDSAMSGLRVHESQVKSQVCWNLQSTYENLNRLIQGSRGAGLLLEDAPIVISFDESENGVVWFSRTEFDNFGLPLTFTELLQIAKKRKDPRTLGR